MDVSCQALAIEPRSEFKARARYEFVSAVGDMAARRERKSTVFSLRWTQVAVSAIVALLVTGSGIVAASTQSLPGQSLYSVKLLADNAQLGLNWSENSRNDYYTRLTETRVDEIIALAELEQVEYIDDTTLLLGMNFIDMVGAENYSQAGVIKSEMVENQAEVTAQLPPRQDFTGEVPESFIIREGDDQAIRNTKEKAMSGYIDIKLAIDQALSAQTKSALQQALDVYIRGYEAAIRRLYQ